jgi:aminopeptidase-like protein
MIASRQQQEAPPQDGPSSRPRPPRKASSGDWMHALATELFPICRSITGDGLRATLRRIQQEIPITIHEVPSGTPVLDWVIPDEWNIRDAWIANARGERVIDFRRNNLHVVNYSVPVRARMQLAELRPHLHTLPDRPEWIPYRTTYYKRDWGFCLSHRQLQELEDGEYDVCIDATLVPGALSYGELLIPGRREEEFLISVHCCHPSLANDNLSGVAVAVALAQTMLQERAGPAQLPLPVHPGNHWGNHMAGSS